jgi:hypothetical protein
MNVRFKEAINVGFIDVSLDIDPHDFLNCETIDDLYYDVKDYYYGNPQGEYSLGNVVVEDSTVECTIPDEFIEEWKKLKADEDSE